MEFCSDYTYKSTNHFLTDSNSQRNRNRCRHESQYSSRLHCK